MGTETQFQSNCLSYGSSQAVKLNNPPMGAETLYPMHRRNYPLLPHIKLNNPLMGPVFMSKTHISTEI